MTNKIRIDKFLWCVRLFKSRKLSNEACRKSKVKVNKKSIKASYIIKVDDKITIKKRLITVSIIVLKVIDRRISAKLLAEYIKDQTPSSEKIKIKLSRELPYSHREKGKGRPTKKERRDLMKGLDDYSKS